jgi:hypothetical protein
MTQSIDITPKRRLAATLGAGFAISAMLALGTFATPASAEWNGYNRGYYHNWNGGYYRAPPVVYGSSYDGGYYGAPSYYGPPVVYGPSVGINLGGVGIGIR